MPFPEEPGTIVFVRIAASEMYMLGNTLLIRNPKDAGLRDEKTIIRTRWRVMAALSLGRISGDFSQLERSKRNGWKTSDAISDYIVVHDRA